MGLGQGALEGMAINLDFWYGRRVLITGHTGFKGAWLSEWLLALGAQPAGYALAPPTRPALFDQLGLSGRMSHQLGDIRDLDRLQAFMQAADPEIVFHMAAQPLVRYSFEAPVETYAVNVLGTAHVLEACRSLPRLRAVIVITTDKCYENREWHWGYRENDPLGGHDPYSSSKACAELVTDSYRRSFFSGKDNRTRIASARAGNVIGGGDWAVDRLIPDVIRAFEAGEPVAIRYPDSIRPWQHVLEPLHGYLMLAEALSSKDGNRYAEAWNFGPEDRDAKPVRWLMDKLTVLWPDHPGWRLNVDQHPHEAGSLKLDCAKAHGRLGWWSALGLDQASQLTVDWYQAHAKRGDLRAITQRQIDDYTKLINGSLA